MQIQETWSEVKVTMTQGWYMYAALHRPKVYRHTKFGIPTSSNIRYAQVTIILKTRPEIKVKVTVTRKWYAARRHPKMHPLSYLEEYKKYASDTKQDGRTVRLLFASQEGVDRGAGVRG